VIKTKMRILQTLPGEKARAATRSNQEQWKATPLNTAVNSRP